MKTLSVSYLHNHPFIGFVASIVMYLAGYKLGTTHDYHFLIQVDPTPEFSIPVVVIQLFQIFAFTGAGITGFVAGHGWYKKNFSKKEKTDDTAEPKQDN